jgi:hypothetical protein
MITTDMCEFYKDTGDMYLSSQHTDGRFPRELVVKSAHTGREITFHPIGPEHPRFDEDGWDGELALYEPAVRDASLKVKVLTIRHDQ